MVSVYCDWVSSSQLELKPLPIRSTFLSCLCSCEPCPHSQSCIFSQYRASLSAFLPAYVSVCLIVFLSPLWPTVPPYITLCAHSLLWRTLTAYEVAGCVCVCVHVCVSGQQWQYMWSGRSGKQGGSIGWKTRLPTPFFLLFHTMPLKILTIKNPFSQMLFFKTSSPISI